MDEIRHQRIKILQFLIVAVMLSFSLSIIASYIASYRNIYVLISFSAFGVILIAYVLFYILLTKVRKNIEFPVAVFFDVDNREVTHFLQYSSNFPVNWLHHVLRAWERAKQIEGLPIWENDGEKISAPRFEFIFWIVEYSLFSIMVSNYGLSWRRNKTTKLPHSSSTAFIDCKATLISTNEISNRFGGKNPLLNFEKIENGFQLSLPPSATLSPLGDGILQSNGFRIETRYIDFVTELLTAELGKFGNKGNIYLAYVLINISYAIRTRYFLWSLLTKRKDAQVEWAEDLMNSLEACARVRPIDEIEEILKGASLFS